jgi:UDP-2,4-diacetamido-2,4,6-trideoxy-beta-L-altropyranose hydrolase
VTRTIAVFRADASPEIGGGHIVRCLSLAHALHATGWDVAFVCGAETITTVPAVGRYRCVPVPPGRLADAALMRDAAPAGCTLAVIDHYELDLAFESQLSGWAARVLVIDDRANRRHAADVLLDQTYGRSSADYAGLVAESCSLLLGSCYALVRKEFRVVREQALASRGRSTMHRLFVSAGASDPQDMTGMALQAIARLELDLSVDVALGSKAPHLASVEEAVARLPRAELHVDSQDIAALMSTADLAIGACGSASWERCCLGLPAIAIVAGADQIMVGRALAVAGAAVVADLSNTGPDWIAASVLDFARNPDRLHHASLQAASLCDGQGVDRVMDTLAAIWKEVPVYG